MSKTKWKCFILFGLFCRERKKCVLDRTDPSNKKLVQGTVPSTKLLVDGTVLSSKELVDGKLSSTRG